jgi:putative DNA primase/helicase
VDGERELHRIWEKADDGLPTIQLVAGERPQITIDAIDALERAAPPLYQRNLTIVNVVRVPAKAADGRKTMTPAVVVVPSQQLQHELGKAAHWLKYDGRREDWVPADVPEDIAKRIMALPNEWLFWPLTGIIATQTMRPDGSLLIESGYDEATGFLLFNPPEMPPLPEAPRRRDAYMALNLLDRLLDEFPFAFDAERYSHAKNPSRSVALSGLMTPVLRAALPPAVPLHVIKAPVGGTGKSYYVDLASGIAIGDYCPVIARSPSVEETEKRLVGTALLGAPIASIDNCNGPLRSEFLCQAVERPVLKVRALGGSGLTHIDNAATWFANGNNIQIAEDLVRRTLQGTMDANMARPETREFEHDPLAEILANRGRYVAAVLTIARAYILAGMPNRPPPFASFNRWSDLVRGSLVWLGRADPVETVAELSIADPVREMRSEVFQAIVEAMPKGDVRGHLVGDIVRMAAENTTLEGAIRLVAEDGGKISPSRLGKWLAASENQIAGGYKLLRNAADKSRVRWQFARLEG